MTTSIESVNGAVFEGTELSLDGTKALGRMVVCPGVKGTAATTCVRLGFVGSHMRFSDSDIVLVVTAHNQPVVVNMVYSDRSREEVIGESPADQSDVILVRAHQVREARIIEVVDKGVDD